MLNNTPTQTPGYKQFWPWFIFFFPAAAVVAGIITLFIAQDMGNDRFLKGYKKVGLAVVSRENTSTQNAHENSSPKTDAEKKKYTTAEKEALTP